MRSCLTAESAPVDEEPLSASTSSEQQPGAPIEDLISALDSKPVECMDDRMSESSGEEMHITDGDPKGA